MKNANHHSETQLMTAKPKKKAAKKPTAKKKKGVISCKSCGQVINPTEHPPSSTWTLTSPLPDKDGRITLTVMGSFTCPRCSKNVKAAMTKIKSDDESGGKSKKEILLETVKGLTENTSLDEIAKKVGLTSSSIEKAISLLIKKGDLNGNLANGFYNVK